MIKLSEDQVRQRFKELNNYKNLLYPQVKERNTRLREEVRSLKERVKELESNERKKDKAFQKLLLESSKSSTSLFS